MGWELDRPKVQSQWDEFQRFLTQARGDQPAGLGDIVGRPFEHPSQPAVTPQPHATPEVNYHLLQVGQLYEAGVIDQRQYQTIINNFYG
jgi:hypothetical protein